MKLSERLEAACPGVLVAEATGNLDIVTDAVNKLLDAAREAAAMARRVEDAPTVCVGLSAVVGVGWQIYGTDGDNIESLPFDGGQRVRLVPAPQEVPDA